MPIHNGNLTYLHIPKTGGTWVTDYLLKEQRGEKIGQSHDPITVLSDDIRGSSLVFITLRDPWSWYASWYQHARARAFKHEDLSRYCPEMSFRGVLRSVTQPWLLDHPKPGVLWNLPPVPKNFRGGLYSWALFHTCGDPLMMGAVLDMYTLRANLELLVGETIPEDLYPPQNTRYSRPKTAVDDPATLYDDEMLRWVAEADITVLRLMRYTEPFKPAKRPIVWM